MRKRSSFIRKPPRVNESKERIWVSAISYLSLGFGSEFGEGSDPEEWASKFLEKVKSLKDKGYQNIKIKEGYGANPDHFTFDRLETDREFHDRQFQVREQQKLDLAELKRLQKKYSTTEQEG